MQAVPDLNGKLPHSYPISLYFRVSNQTPYYFDDLSNGLRVYSPDAATWEPGFLVDTTIWGPFHGDQTLFDTTWYGEFLDQGMPDTILGWREAHYSWGFKLGIFSDPRVGGFDLDGVGADTFWFSGAAPYPENVGVFSGFTADPAWVVRLQSIYSSSAGKTICIDSSYYPPSGVWQWSGPSVELAPEWDGPHCFEIVDCCVGRRGNIDLEYLDINIADLRSLLRQVYVKNQLQCPVACNVDGDPQGTVDILDLVYLVDYMFRGGPEPPACP